MNVLRSRFFQAVAIFVLAFVVLRFGIRPPAPWSVLSLYMFIISLALLIFVSSDSRLLARLRASDLADPHRSRRYRMLRSVIVVAVPLLLGYYAYTQAAARPQAPPELRAVHPAPPASIQFRGKEINIAGFDNPLRKDAAAFKKHAAAGGEIYIRNCVYCHGDNLDGKGHFAYGFNPPPANFQDPGTIAMLQEAYLFWRIAKGGPGPAQGIHAVELGHAGLGRSAHRGADLAGHHVPVRRHRAAAAPLGDGPLMRPSRARRWPSSSPRAAPAFAQGDAKAGQTVYEHKCLLCHGDKGDGKGPGAEHLVPKPRDFTKGLYKIRTTANKTPFDQDLHQDHHRRHARDLDAAVGSSPREGPREPGRLPQDVRAGRLQGGAQEARAAQGRGVLGGVDQARQGDVRGDRVPQVPRNRRAGRRSVARPS